MEAFFLLGAQKKTILVYYVNLFPQKLAGREACGALEKAGEMMREIEAEQARGLADVVALHEQTLGLIDDVVVDIADGCAACGLADEVAKIARRIGQFGGAIGYGGHTLRQLAVLAKIGLQQVVEPLQQVVAALAFLGKQALVDAVAVFQYQAQIAQQDGS